MVESKASLEENTSIPIDNLMKMLTFFIQITFFQLGSDIYQQEEYLAMDLQLSSKIANIYIEYIEYFKEMALGIVH